MGRGCSAAAVLVGAWALLGASEPAAAARIEVDSTADAFGSAPGRCSVREAFESVNRAADFGGCEATGSFGYYDAIVLRNGVHRLSLPSLTEPVVPADADNAGGDLDLIGGNQVVLMSVPGDGATIDASGVDRALEVVNVGATMLIQGVTIRGGRTNGDGGGLLTFGDAILLMSAAVGNVAGGAGGAIAAVGERADVTLLNSTVAGNRGARGGGVSVSGAAADTTLDLFSSTISRNRAPRGGGISVDAGTARIENTILALNRARGRPSDCAGGQGAAMASFGANLLSRSCPALRLRPRDIVSRRPGVLPLARNGGPAPTNGLSPRSPAVGGAKQGLCYHFDGRGVPRRLGGRCDIGAYERVSCGGVLVDAVGSRRGEVLAGGPGADGLLGLGGDDRLLGGNGDDALCGGAGDDVLHGGAGDDLLDGGEGSDRCLGGGHRRACERRR